MDGRKEMNVIRGQHTFLKLYCFKSMNVYMNIYVIHYMYVMGICMCIYIHDTYMSTLHIFICKMFLLFETSPAMTLK